MGYAVVPEAPAWIARYPRALEKWNDLWGKVLEPTRITPAAHGDIVGQYCIYYSDMRDALEKLERGKLVGEKKTTGVGDKAKVTVEKLGVSPYQRIFDNAVQKMERLGKMIGLDPVNPLEAARTFADYAEILGDDGDGEGDNVDDGSSTNDGGQPGDAGEPATTGSDGGNAQSTGDGGNAVPADSARKAEILDG